MYNLKLVNAWLILIVCLVGLRSTSDMSKEHLCALSVRVFPVTVILGGVLSNELVNSLMDSQEGSINERCERCKECSN